MHDRFFTLTSRRLAVFFTIAVVALGSAGFDAQERRVIRVTAERFSFTPSRIEIDAGEEVELRIKSDDTAHGFRIVGLAEDGDLDTLIAEAVQEASWCSSDPLCIEREAAGVDALNNAACHACLLLPEVSCEEMNVLLDRALLVGTPVEPDLGFFSALLE